MNNLAKIDFYKRSGKWYSSAIIDMQEVEPWHKENVIVAKIRQNQRALTSDFRDFYVVMSDTPENYADLNYAKIWNRLFSPEQMDNI